MTCSILCEPEGLHRYLSVAPVLGFEAWVLARTVRGFVCNEQLANEHDVTLGSTVRTVSISPALEMPPHPEDRWMWVIHCDKVEL